MTSITVELTTYEVRALRKVLGTLGGAYSYHARTIELILDKLDEAEVSPRELTIRDLERLISKCFGSDTLPPRSELSDEEVEYLLSLKYDTALHGAEYFKDGT